ncbi:hypothetical protein [Congregibacter litoralis]|uniref:Uncharacterized protein n=1 Tax=Congregibacter litoralis KT71 TaxID=314285 RepID=A4A8G6_9GAMM|nr:hypothetical protein [Congregibacter litoralis]EAQ97961.1 hypothetical protein KT71_15389 [Congregibacter litoralis KT71]
MDKHPDMGPYVACMNEIKLRYKIANSFNTGERNAIYDVPTMEVMILQFRMIFELIALSSLSAHAKIFEDYQVKFQKKWRVTDIFGDLEKLNKNFYPRPIREVPSARENIKNDLIDISDGYLTKEELVSAHGQCGGVLHARNPFGRQIDPATFRSKLDDWSSKVITLLNTHVVTLLDDEFMYLIQFNAIDQPVRTYVFGKASEQQGD